MLNCIFHLGFADTSLWKWRSNFVYEAANTATKKNI